MKFAIPNLISYLLILGLIALDLLIITRHIGAAGRLMELVFILLVINVIFYIIEIKR